jgi:hypothetical protein
MPKSTYDATSAVSNALKCSLVVAAVLALLPTVARAAEIEELGIRAKIEAFIELDTARGVPRLPRVTMDPATGDLTVVFAMRRPLSDDPTRVVASATDDIFNILWAAYTTQTFPPVRTATVLGTYGVTGRYSRAREIPLVRAVLTATSAAGLDWNNATALDPRAVFDVWWVEGELLAASPAD